jgi:hypothetical protein
LDLYWHVAVVLAAGLVFHSMSFGIDQLTDDQLLELLQEACVELGRRDPIIRGLAQQGIATEAETMVARRAALEKAIEKEQKKYLQEISKEAEEEVQKAAKAGTLRLATPIEEADEIAESTIAARIEVVEKIIKQASGVSLPNENPGDFFCRITPENTVSMAWNGQRLHWNIPQECPFIHSFLNALSMSWQRIKT